MSEMKPSAVPAVWMNRLVFSLLALGIAALLVIKWHLLTRLNINWDEFVFLSWLFDYRRGELSTGLQTFHVHLTSWIAHIDGTAVDQILAGRVQAFVLRLGICVALFFIGRHLFGTLGAMVSIIASLAFSFVMAHGESFRADPILAFLFLSAAAFAICGMSSLRHAALAGALMGLAGVITVKAIFFVPTFGFIYGIRSAFDGEFRRYVISALTFGVCGFVTALTLFGLHAVLIMNEAPVDAIAGHASRAANFMLGSFQPAALAATLDWDRAFWLTTIVGAFLAIHTLVAKGEYADKRSAAMVLALALPILSLFIYRNTFPYFYVCVIPGASLLVGFLVSRITHLVPQAFWIAQLAALVLASTFGSTAWTFFLHNSMDNINQQRILLEGVAEMFPSPVPYVDRCSMVADYPKVGLFMSTAVLQMYRSNDRPLMRVAFERKQPHFLIINSPGLMLNAPFKVTQQTVYALLEEDFRFLQEQFVPHWGPVWVRAVRGDLSASDTAIITVAIPGPYTLESALPVAISGSVRQPGDVITLAAGQHLVTRAGPDAGSVFTLRIGNRLIVPDNEPPSGLRLFTGLGFRRPS